MSTPLERLRAGGWELPPLPQPKGMYVPARRHGDLLHLSAHGPFGPDGGFTHRGVVGDALTLSEGRAAAAATALSLLASAAGALGDLSAISGVLRMTGYVNAAAGFEHHARVLDGASEVLEAAFGPDARPARSVVGVASLPFDLPIVTEATFVVGAEPAPEARHDTGPDRGPHQAPDRGPHQAPDPGPHQAPHPSPDPAPDGGADPGVDDG